MNKRHNQIKNIKKLKKIKLKFLKELNQKKIIFKITVKTNNTS